MMLVLRNAKKIHTAHRLGPQLPLITLSPSATICLDYDFYVILLPWNQETSWLNILIFHSQLDFVCSTVWFTSIYQSQQSFSRCILQWDVSPGDKHRNQNPQFWQTKLARSCLQSWDLSNIDPANAVECNSNMCWSPPASCFERLCNMGKRTTKGRVKDWWIHRSLWRVYLN